MVSPYQPLSVWSYLGCSLEAAIHPRPSVLPKLAFSQCWHCIDSFHQTPAPMFLHTGTLQDPFPLLITKIFLNNSQGFEPWEKMKTTFWQVGKTASLCFAGIPLLVETTPTKDKLKRSAVNGDFSPQQHRLDGLLLTSLPTDNLCNSKTFKAHCGWNWANPKAQLKCWGESGS